MLTDARAAESVLFESGAADAMAPGTIVVDMSTTSPPVAKDHARGSRRAELNMWTLRFPAARAAHPAERWRSWPAAMPKPSRGWPRSSRPWEPAGAWGPSGRGSFASSPTS